MKTFIKENAIYEVNLPDTIRSILRKSIEQILAQQDHAAPPEIFDAAQNEIFTLMSNDSFHRFIKMEESFVELSTNQTSDNGSKASRKDGETVSYGSPEKDLTPSRHNSLFQSNQDIEMEPLDKPVKEDNLDENQQIFVL